MANLTGLEKSALLLLSLNDEEAAGVLRHLGPRRVQLLVRAMVNFQSVPRQQLEEMLAQFDALPQLAMTVVTGTSRVRRIAALALGEEKVDMLMSHLQRYDDKEGLENLRWLDASAVVEIIRHEHPQIVAAILVHLDHDQGGEVVRLLPERLRNNVILRLATMESVQPVAVEALNDALENMLHRAPAWRLFKDGERLAANILNFVGTTTEQSVLDSLRAFSPELAERILDKMFVFENLMHVNDRDIQTLLHELQPDQLLIALKGASIEMREKFFSNMSQRAASALRDDLDAKGPVRLSDVEKEQKEILRIARRLVEDRQITIYPRSVVLGAE